MLIPGEGFQPSWLRGDVVWVVSTWTPWLRLDLDVPVGHFQLNQIIRIQLPLMRCNTGYSNLIEGCPISNEKLSGWKGVSTILVKKRYTKSHEDCSEDLED
jgi:hypothetical protein